MLKIFPTLFSRNGTKHLSPTQTQGKEAEELALHHLEKKGYRLKTANYRTKMGEIDLIMEKGENIIFVEVRERKSNAYGTPAESVTSRKQKRIAKAALMFVKENRLANHYLRFDIVSVQNEKITHLENAFAPTGYIY
ncbi:MAG: YraN family protein [Elusimicrobia bacterium]|nr:YraN family protein [Elusimicrobiota bacterium]